MRGLGSTPRPPATVLAAISIAVVIASPAHATPQRQARGADVSAKVGSGVETTAARTRIVAMRLGLRGVGRPGPSYRVRVTVPVRVCGGRGVTRLSISQRKLLGGRTFASKRSSLRRRQTRRCQTFRLSFGLGDRFFGVGRYVVGVRADARGRAPSRVVRRSQTTID